MNKKLLILSLLSVVILFVMASDKRIFGYFTQRQLAGAITQWFLSDSPGNSVGNSKLVVETKDSTYYNMYFENFGLYRYGSSRNDGTPTSVLWTDATGNVKRSPMPAFLTTEVDPIWSGVAANYRTKLQNDALYNPLLGFTPYNATNPAGYISGITSGMVTTALGFTPYNSTNPNNYINQAGARSAISLTTTGSNGPATYNFSTGAFNIPNYTVTAGTGISVSGSNVITNTAPDQTVSLTGSNGISVTGTYPSFNVARTKRQETYSGTTNGSGVYTGTFGTAYGAAPNIQANIVGGTPNQMITMTVTTTGFTCTVVQRNSVTLLGIEVLLAATAPVSGANVDVIVTEK